MSKTQKIQRWMMPQKEIVRFETAEIDLSQLGPREMLIRVKCTAVSPGTECANFLGIDPDSQNGWCAYPWQPGYSAVGQILEVGSAVSDYAVGDWVIAPAGHGSHAVVNADGLVIKLDPSLSPEVASFVPILGITATPLQVLNLETYDLYPTVGVWGLGLIGNLVAQVLRSAGANVIGIDPEPARRELAERCGIRTTLDPNASGFAQDLRALTGGEGLDVAVECTGIAKVLIGMPSLLRRRGQLILMTEWRSQPVLDCQPFIHDLFWNGVTLHGSHMCVPGSEPSRNNWNELTRRKYRKLQQRLLTGDIVLEPLITHRVKPEQCEEVYRGLIHDRNRWLGVVVDWTT